MSRLTNIRRSHVAITLLLLCIISACTPKRPTNQQEWDALIREPYIACMNQDKYSCQKIRRIEKQLNIDDAYSYITPVTWKDRLFQPTTDCLNGDQRACRLIKEIARQYEKDHPCPYTAPPRDFEDRAFKTIMKAWDGNTAELDSVIDEARKNNYGECRDRSSLGTSIRFIKGSGLYLAKRYEKSANEYQQAFAELGPDNNIDKEMGIPFLAFYPAALIKAGNLQSAKDLLKTPMYTPIQQLEEPLVHSLFKKMKHVFPDIQIEQYSTPVLIGTFLVTEVNERGNQLVKLAMIDALKTLAPYTPVPKFILEYE